VERIGWSLAKQLDEKPISAFEDGPDKRVGAILNQSTAATREDVLEALDQEDAVFATSVRKEIFTFAHIPRRLSPRDVPAVIRQVDQGDLVTALAAATEGSDAESKEFLLANMSARMADNLRDEVTEAGTIKQADGEDAMNRCINAIRQLETDGVLDLIIEDED
jgi:flagellar motor switch protein FliG